MSPAAKEILQLNTAIAIKEPSDMTAKALSDLANESPVSTTASPKPISGRWHALRHQAPSAFTTILPPPGGGRHQVRVLPPRLPGCSAWSPFALLRARAERTLGLFDFFGNSVTSIAFRDAHDALDIGMRARAWPCRGRTGARRVTRHSAAEGGNRHGTVAVTGFTASFLAPSDHADIDPAITDYAKDSVGSSTFGTVMDLCERIHRDFTYDGRATTRRTRASDAFGLKRGVCQDFRT